VYKITYYNNIDFDEVVSIYCAKILLKYLDMNTKIFDKKRYISDVYLKNIDVYGLIMSFLPYISNYNYSTIKIKGSDNRQVVITGTRTPHYIKDVPVRTEVITAREIETKNASNIYEVLEGIPGIRVEQQCQFCNFSIIFNCVL
jgi:hypothetical protein